MKAPKTFGELREFYLGTFTPLYDRFINAGAVAQEIHSELAAALDHLFCKASKSTGELPAAEVSRAAAHIKRATFDGFKLVFEREIRRPYEKFMGNRYADVHDGNFRREITAKWCEAREIASNARSLERKTRGLDVASWHAAFDEWQKIIPIADYFVSLETDSTVIRAHRMNRLQLTLQVVVWIATLLLGALLSWLVS